MSEQWQRRPQWRPGREWRRPPPWWPSGEQFPPSGYAWRHRGRRIARRAGCAIGVLLLLFGAAGTALVWLILSAVGVVGSGPFARVVSAAALLLGLAAFVIAAFAARRLTGLAAGLISAAQRVEAGDYSARVEVRGPGELRTLARALNSMSSKLESEETRRRSVLADVAHELRTPLTVIRGQAEGIVDGVYEATPERMAPIIAATSRLEALVEDLRTLALAETGNLRLHLEPVELPLLVHETLAALDVAAADAGVRLIDEVPAGIPVVDADPIRLGSVLTNVVSNALRHTPRGGTVHVVATPAGTETVRVAVVDDGEGIPAELLPRVFDRFVRTSSSQGSGLGLAIVRDIVEAHGGSVTARNNPQRGATIEFSLPVERASGLRSAPSQAR
ncbi:MAG: HAMP domain-containing histidine kinase [Candidatus Dormibacteraeota bacterium]|nr:HAMP domain-containing histidine kinase [Candidatus Dormibacteraeota bacterium]